MSVYQVTVFLISITYMEQSPLRETNRLSANQESLLLLQDRVRNNPSLGLILSQLIPVHMHPTALISILILSSHLRPGLPSCLFLSGFGLKLCIHFSSHA